MEQFVEASTAAVINIDALTRSSPCTLKGAGRHFGASGGCKKPEDVQDSCNVERLRALSSGGAGKTLFVGYDHSISSTSQQERWLGETQGAVQPGSILLDLLKNSKIAQTGGSGYFPPR